MDRNPSDSRLTFGVVGLGYWGPNLLRVLADNLGIDVRWICDLDEGAPGGRPAGIPARGHTRFQDLLDDPELDAVMIATPVVTHVALATRSLMAGKHTFVEKPLATSSADADELFGWPRSRRRVLMCGQTFLYSPAVRAVKAMLDEGKLGDIYFISSSRVNLGLHQRDISVIWDLGRTTSRSCSTGSASCRRRCARSGGTRSSTESRTSPSSTWSSRPGWSPTSSSAGWRRASCGAPWSSAARRWSSTTTGRASRCACSTPGVVYRDPESFGEYHLSYRDRRRGVPEAGLLRALARRARGLRPCDRIGSSEADIANLSRDVVRVDRGGGALAAWAEGAIRSSAGSVRSLDGRCLGGGDLRGAREPSRDHTASRC